MIEILLVEDDPNIHQLIQMVVSSQPEYKITSAYSGTEALLRLQHDSFDLILLDLMLPGMTGIDLLEQVRDVFKGAVIVLSAIAETSDKVQLLRLGADDYMTKPFDNDELLARIETVLRRYGYQNQIRNSQILTYKALVIDSTKHTAMLSGHPLHLTVTEFDILQLLLSAPHQVFSRAQLYTRIWGDDIYIEDNAINVHISNLRKKIQAIVGDEPYIETVWGIGFKLADSSEGD